MDRVTESITPSPFQYQRNCLLFLPISAPRKRTGNLNRFYDETAGEILDLVKAANGHALVLFTSYTAMSAVKERLLSQSPCWPVFTMGSNPMYTVQQFKRRPGNVLLATGAAWEGFDFPGDCVSLLIIPRLPFPIPDAVKERKKQNYAHTREFIQAVAVPEMQMKLMQGAGRSIRTETDTCVIAILDERAAPGHWYHRDVKTALPHMPVTRYISDVERFIRKVKSAEYFREAARL